ncbi:MAG: DUF305 domain-containing protein [Kaiparowitsia implicata GSE-PSE-MK54-09C]|jgi:uncharacterized protein (DUF305 family)|nr:DUF305 domain-containing protein [Kaiparowitsia implicata GSE-PSE-MK54-09C]
MKIQRKSLSILVMAALSAVVVGCTHSAETTSESATTDHSEMGHGSADVNGMDHASMDLGPADATFDLRFLDAMMLHHEGAVVMAEEALEKSSRDEILTLSQDIIAAQQAEIAQMQEWRQAWYPTAGDELVMYHAEMNHDMPMSAEMASMMRMDMPLGAADAEVDLRFINGMIPHHEGALEMAQEVLEKSDRPELQALAEEILAVQQEEIDQMETWRKEWYGQ